MEKLFSLDYGVAGICVLLTIHILVKVGEFLWRMRKEKESASEQAVQNLTQAVQANTAASQHLERRLEGVELAVADYPKLKKDVRRSFAAIKELAGDDWPRIREEIMKDEFTA